MCTFALMKRLCALIISFMLLFSCSKESKEENADKFVGTYSISATEYVTWGSASGTLSNTGTLYISKKTESSVSTNGFFSTNGSITESTIYFEGFNTSDATGYITYTFSPATLNGNVMFFTVYASGRLADNGVSYPYRMTSNVTAIKM